MDVRQLWENYEPMLLQIGLTVLAAVFLLIVGFWLINWLARQVSHVMQKRNMDVSVLGFLTKFLEIGLKVLLLLSIAGMSGVETASFIAILSALSLAVGLALQGNLGHFASGILLDRGIDVFVRTLNDSSVDLACRAWTENANYWAALIYLDEAVKKAFDREGVSIPFPQRDVHFKCSDALA